MLVVCLILSSYLTSSITAHEGCISLVQGHHLQSYLHQVSSKFRETKSLSNTPNILVLLIDFDDLPSTVDRDTVEQIFNTRTIESHPMSGGFSDYFEKNSYGQFVPNCTIAGWYRADSDYSYYRNDITSTQAADSLFIEAMSAASIDPEIDLSLYDNDGDGISEGVIVLTSDKIRTQARFGTSVHYNGIDYNSYAMSFLGQNDLRLGTTIHEYGHILGLPDLYLTKEPIGLFGLMSHAKGTVPGNLCAWSKVRLGWVTPEVIDTTSLNKSIHSASTHSEILKIWSDPYRHNRYFLLENRSRSGYDLHNSSGGVPAEGLILYHVDDSYGNELVRIMQADGMEDLRRWYSSDGSAGNVGDSGDSFPGSTDNRTFDKNSIPNSNSFFNINYGLKIKNISEVNDIMTADIYPIDLMGTTLRVDPDYSSLLSAPTSRTVPFQGTNNDSIWGGSLYSTQPNMKLYGFSYARQDLYTVPAEIDEPRVHLKLYTSLNNDIPSGLFHSESIDVPLPPSEFNGDVFFSDQPIVWLDHPINIPSTLFGTYCPIKKKSDAGNGNKLKLGNITNAPTLTTDDGIHFIYGDDSQEWDQDEFSYSTLLLFVRPLKVNSGTIYVDEKATGTADGTSWEDAYTTLQEALDEAEASANIRDIWMARGTYRPTVDISGNSSNAVTENRTFNIDFNVNIYGGFCGWEASKSQRVKYLCPTILSGDQNMDDVYITNNLTLGFPADHVDDNSYNIMRMKNSLYQMEA